MSSPIMSHYCAVKSLILSWMISAALTAAIDQPDVYKSANPGLYNSSDRVIVLNVTNFKSKVYRSDRAWLVEFYNSWCGFCQRYASTWKSLASDISHWQNIVSVAALDCADEENNPLCREYEIMHYPEVRYFAPNADASSLGLDVEKGKDAESLRHNLILRMRKEQQEGRGSSWPNITPYRSSETKNLWDGISAEKQFFLFVFEEVDSVVGPEIILDVRDLTGLLVRSVNSDNSLLCLMHKITRFPSLIVYNRDGQFQRLSSRSPTRESMVESIRRFYAASSGGQNTSNRDSSSEKGKKVDWKIPASEETKKTEKEKNEQKKAEPEEEEEEETESILRKDLEVTLRYALSHEIPMTKTIEGEKMLALKNFTKILAGYLPLKAPMFLGTINAVIASKDRISGEEFGALVASTEEEMAPVYEGKSKDWTACRASGYPCGLWKLFHVLTANFAIQSRSEEPNTVLRGIHGYVTNFFGCADCARHFAAMASEDRIFEVADPKESAIWLWRAHNRVNRRLAGEETSLRRGRRKIQYPSTKICPECHLPNGQWNESEVFRHLTKKYATESFGDGNATIRSSRSSGDYARRERLAGKHLNVTKFGWDLTIFDISICVLLYVTSAAILILVCVKFAVKKSYKKKIYVHSILGKV